MTKTVPFEELRPGMILAEPVLNRWGQILLNKGCILSEGHISALKTWGICRVVIEKESGAGKFCPLGPEALERIRKRVKARLLWEPQTPLEQEILSLAVEQAQRRAQGHEVILSGTGEECSYRPGPPDRQRLGGQRTAF